MRGKIPGGRSFQPVKGLEIKGSYAAFPEPIKFPFGSIKDWISNEDIFQMLLGNNYAEILKEKGMAVDYPEKVIGLKYRRWTHLIGQPADHDEENSVDLGVKAGKGLLAKLDLAADDIDFLILSSTTPHKITSSTACAIASELGIKAPCIDIKAGCTSGLYSLLTAGLYAKTGFQNVLLIGSETPSKYANPQIQETVMNVGDGAVAILISSGDAETGIAGGFLGADGDLGKLVNTPGLVPPTHAAIDAGLYYYHGQADQLKEAVPVRYIEAMQVASGIAGLKPSELDIYIPHQINRALTGKVAQIMEIPEEKQFHNLHKYGNLAGSSVLVALHDALENNMISKGDKAGLNVVGGGLTWGGIVWQF